jgi:hypothetical protein
MVKSTIKQAWPRFPKPKPESGGGAMKIIRFIEEIEIIEMVLRHLGFWDIRNHDPPALDSVHLPELVYDHSDSQIPAFDY